MTLFIITILFLSTGFNYNFGTQNDFNLNGIIVDKREKTKLPAIVAITVRDENTSEKYKIDVSNNTYKKFDLNDKINISGKR